MKSRIIHESDILGSSTKLQKLMSKIIETKLEPQNLRQQYLQMAANKAYNLSLAINLLNSIKLEKEAAQLVRSLMELQFITQYLLIDKTEKELEKYLDYYNVYRKKLYDNIKANEISIDLIRMFMDILIGDRFTEDDIYKNAAKSQLKHSYPNHGWINKSLYQMVKETSGIEFYRHYYYLYSEAIHSSIANLYDYMPDRQQGLQRYLLATNSMVTFLATILIFQKYCQEFNLSYVKKIEKLMKQAGLDVERH